MGFRRIDKTIEVCDICGREGVLMTCLVCGRRYCLICQGVGTNPYDQDICRDCIHRDDVESIMKDTLPAYHKAKSAQKERLNVLNDKSRLLTPEEVRDCPNRGDKDICDLDGTVCHPEPVIPPDCRMYGKKIFMRGKK